MKLKDVVGHLHRVEGKKIKISIANVRELVAILSDLVWADPTVIEVLGDCGRKRALKREHERKLAAKRKSR